MRRASVYLLLAFLLSFDTLQAARAQAAPPAYATLASQPDPLDFVSRSDTQLTLQDNPFRFGGVTIPWLGLRRDGAAPARRPTAFEVRDALATALALGASVIRLPGLVSTFGCALCLEPVPGSMDPEAFARIDRVLASARDLGLKVILPLADAGADCTGPGADGIICASGGPAFFADAQVRARFITRVRVILTHLNSLTNTPYKDDPTILAWEDCDACAASGDDQAVSAWVEQLGQAVKATDRHHLYEDGAFATRIGRGAAHPAGPILYAGQSVDAVGLRMPDRADAATATDMLADMVDGVVKAGRVPVLDNYGWAPAVWKTQAEFDAWLFAMARNRHLAGAVTGNLQAHADQGGYLPPPPTTEPATAAFYFPGMATPDADLSAMQQRGRAIHRFDYAMGEVAQTPAYLLPPKPEVVSVVRGRVTWRGAAGAAAYTIERSPDPSQPFSWITVCDACAAGNAATWQDPHMEPGPAWYRVMPFNINGHKANYSDPMQSTP